MNTHSPKGWHAGQDFEFAGTRPKYSVDGTEMILAPHQGVDAVKRPGAQKLGTVARGAFRENYQFRIAVTMHLRWKWPFLRMEYVESLCGQQLLNVAFPQEISS